MNDIKDAIEGLKDLKPLLQAQLLKTNYEGMGVSDAKEIGEHFDAAIMCMEHQLTNGWIPVSEWLPEKDGMYLITSNLLGKSEVQYVFFQSNIPLFICNGNAVAWQPLPEPYKEAL